MPRALQLVGANVDLHPIIGKRPDLLDSDGDRGACANSVQVTNIPPRRSCDLNHSRNGGGLWLDNSHDASAPPLWLQPLPQQWSHTVPVWDHRTAAPASSPGGGGGQGGSCGGGGSSGASSDTDPHRVPEVWWTAAAQCCEDGQPISDAVDALTHLVERQRHIPYTLFYRLLKRCTAQKNLALGHRIHALTVRSGYAGHAFLATHLIGMYASHGRLAEALQVFHTVPAPDTHNWAAIIVACAKHGAPAQAIRLYRHMMMCGSGGAVVEPDNHIFSAVLKACAAAGDLNAGRDVHAHICASARRPDMVVQTGLVNMYAKCGGVEEARIVFDQLPRKDVFTWTAMIAGYAQQGMPHEALRMYARMRQEERVTPPDAVTFLSLLQACAAVAALPLGTHLHAEIRRLGLQSHHGVGNALVHMYAKCGSMVDAHHVFDSLPQRDVVAWGALIAGYTRHGRSEVVFELVDRMRQAGVQPNAVTLLCVLTVCCHAGLVDKGRRYFAAMSRGDYDYGGGVRPTIEHYTCVVDMLGRAGRLDEALEVVETMPFPADATVWSTLLGACRTWKNVEVGERAFRMAVRQDGRNAGAYVLMSGIYASAGMWEEAEQVQARRVQAGACKPAGRSWTEDPKGVVHAFDMAVPSRPI